MVAVVRAGVVRVAPEVHRTGLDEAGVAVGTVAAAGLRERGGGEHFRGVMVRLGLVVVIQARARGQKRLGIGAGGVRRRFGFSASSLAHVYRALFAHVDLRAEFSSERSSEV